MKKIVTRSLVPNLLTLMNLYSGFAAIIYISQGDFQKGALFILIGAIFDMLDGVAARLVRSASEFGGELDSLCDAVTFGVAPSYMLHEVYFYQLGDMGIFFAALPAIAGVARLARFNVQLTSFEDKRYFKGLPIPASALTIITYIIFFHLTDIIGLEIKKIAIFAVPIITSAVMVSNIKHDNMPRPTPGYIKNNPVIFTVALLAVIASIITKGWFIFPFMIIYILFSAVRHLINWIRTKDNPVDDIDESVLDDIDTNVQ